MSVHCPKCGLANWLPSVAKGLEKELEKANRKIKKLEDLASSPRTARDYAFDLCETNDGSFQLCINLDALTPEEARKEADEIVSVWNANTVGVS